ncbi:sporulation protein YabP [Ruminococcus sp.]|uniref:sporulation protein YabP n=1 Tax=Ruminococcus sp. TaxID=41978 RepID=UPI0025D5B7D5|nr:sporulation protein YabP [Ruminococcus sp.]MBQ8967073.1 sporulation protein YabP [Ruminococcus sp.]
MTEIQGRHNAIMEDRSKLMLTGVNDVERFDENTVVLYTQLGELTMKGEKLHISEMSVENGEMNIDGEVTALIYGQRDAVSRLGFFGKLFR